MTFRPLSSSNSMGQNWNEVNNMVRQLNKEQTTKTFKQAGGNAIIEGKLPYTTSTGIPAYGLIFYDSDGVPRMIMGIMPDGTMGLVISKDGENVIDLFS